MTEKGEMMGKRDRFIMDDSKKQFEKEWGELFGEKSIPPTQMSKDYLGMEYELWKKLKHKRIKLTLPVQVLPLSGETLIAEMLIRNKLSELNIDVEFT